MSEPVIVADYDPRWPEDLPEVAARLGTIGYAYEGDKGVPGHHVFQWPPGEKRHHVYVCAPDSEELRCHLRFRDYLRTRPKEATRYGPLKRDLAGRFRDDRLAYSEAKTDYVKSVLEKSTGR